MNGDGIYHTTQMCTLQLSETLIRGVVSENYNSELIINKHEIKISMDETYSSISMSVINRNQSNCHEY
jgi:hypothetical protein